MANEYFNTHPEYDDSEDAQRAFEESNEMSDDSPVTEKGFIYLQGPDGPIKVEMSESDLEEFKKNPDRYARNIRKKFLVMQSDFWRKMIDYRRFPVLGGEYILFMIDVMENESEATVFMEIHPNPEAKQSIPLVEILGSPSIQQYIAFCVAWEYGFRISDYHDLSMKMLVEDHPDKKSAKISIIAHCDQRTLKFIQDTSPIDWVSTSQENICMDSEYLGVKYHSQFMYVKHIYEPVFGIEGIYTFGGLEEIDFLNENINTEKVFMELCYPPMCHLVGAIYPNRCVSSMLAWSNMKYVHFMLDIERTHKMIKITIYAIPGYITNDKRECMTVSYFGDRELLMNVNPVEIIDPEIGGTSFNQTIHWMEVCSSPFSQVFSLTALNSGCTIANGDIIIPLHFYELLFLFEITASESAINHWKECAFEDDEHEIEHPFVVTCETIRANHPIVRSVHIPKEAAYFPENPTDPDNHVSVQVMGFIDCNQAAGDNPSTNLHDVLDPFITKYMGVPVGADNTTWNATNSYLVHCYDSDSVMRIAVITQTIGPYVDANASDGEPDNKKK